MIALLAALSVSACTPGQPAGPGVAPGTSGAASGIGVNTSGGPAQTPNGQPGEGQPGGTPGAVDPGVPGDSQTRTVGGQATLKGKPLADATVKVFARWSKAPFATTTSDSHGHFEVVVPDSVKGGVHLKVIVSTGRETLATVLAAPPGGAGGKYLIQATDEIDISEATTLATLLLGKALGSAPSDADADAVGQKLLNFFSQFSPAAQNFFASFVPDRLADEILNALDPNGVGGLTTSQITDILQYSDALESQYRQITQNFEDYYASHSGGGGSNAPAGDTAVADVVATVEAGTVSDPEDEQAVVNQTNTQ